MNAKNLILGLSVAAIGLSSCCNTSTKTNVSLKNEADTASFYIGYMYGSNITGNGIEDINMDAIIAGMNSALQKKDAPADMMQMNMFLQKYTQKAMMAKAEKALKAGEEFLAANAKKDGIKTTESGLQTNFDSRNRVRLFIQERRAYRISCKPRDQRLDGSITINACWF